MSSSFKYGDLVWARMKGFSPWPALISSRVVNNVKKQRKGLQWVFFFGTRDHGWVEDHNIKPYHEFKDTFKNGSTAAKFKRALVDIEDYIKKKEEDPNYSLEIQTVEEVEDENDKFNRLASAATTATTPKNSEEKPKKKKIKITKMKRQVHEATTSGGSYPKKRARTGSPKMEENGNSFFDSDLSLPHILNCPESPTIDLSMSELLKTKNIAPSSLTFGFLGLGNMGSGIVKNLINSGHKINLWSRSCNKKCEELKKQADANKVGQVNICLTPCDVVQNSDIIFSCLSDPKSAKEIVHGNCGVVHSVADGDGLEGKGYVEMTGIDAETSKDINEIIKSKGGRYLEAQIQGSKNEADEGTLVIISAGDQTLFTDCQSCFKAMSKTAIFLGDVGYAAQVNLILHLMKGVALTGLAESLALADKAGISHKDLLKIFNLTNLACPYITNKAEKIINKEFMPAEQKLQHMQKDLKLVLELSDRFKQPLMMASMANEMFKHARRLGYDEHDASIVYMRARH